MKPDESEAGAAKVPGKDRASLEFPVYPVSDEEAERRMAEAEEDPGVMITLDELVEGLKMRGR